MKVKLFDCCTESYEGVEIGDVENIDEAIIIDHDDVEILVVCYKDGTIKRYIPSGRHESGYFVFSKKRSINLFKDEEWLNRTSSTSYLWRNEKEDVELSTLLCGIIEGK